MDSTGTNVVPSGQLWYIAGLVGTMVVPMDSALLVVGKVVLLVTLLLLLGRTCSLKETSSVEEGDTSSTLLSILELV